VGANPNPITKSFVASQGIGYEVNMSRNLAALGAVIVVGVLLWLVMAWRAPKDELPEKPPLSAAPLAEPEPVPDLAPALATAKPVPAPAPELDEPQPSPPPPRVLEEQIKGDQGPVAEYRSRSQTEPRDSEAPAVESMLRAAFAASNGASDLIKTITCRETICKIEMQWSMERMRPYIAGLTRSQPGFKLPVAVSPVGPKDANGVRPIEVYLKRKPPTPAGQIEPPHAH
jgi:type IV secretory pathway VirB10-like protein